MGKEIPNKDGTNFLVGIACRLDNELLSTIQSMKESADDFSSIDVVIYNQDEEHTMWKQSQFPDNVTLVNVEYSKTTTVTHARYVTQAYIKPQHKYYLGIDSHTQFDKGWDTLIKNAIDGYGKKVVLTSYPPGYYLDMETTPYTRTNETMIVPLANALNDSGIIQKSISFSDEDVDYHKSIFAGGYHATTIDWLWEVGYDPYTHWKYEEIDLALRSYTHGYDLMNYKITPVYHLYGQPNRKFIDAYEWRYGMGYTDRINSKILGKNRTYMESRFSMGNKRSIRDFNKEYNTDIYKFINGLLDE